MPACHHYIVLTLTQAVTVTSSPTSNFPSTSVCFSVRVHACVTVISALVLCGGVPVEDGMREAVPGGKNSNTESLAAVRAESETWYVQ